MKQYFYKAIGYAFWALGCFGVMPVHAQSILYGYPNLGPNGAIISVDLETCQQTVISTITQPGNFTDFVMMPNGSIYLLGFSMNSPAILLLDAPSGTWTVKTVLSPPNLAGSMLAISDTTILVTTLGVFFVYNINTNIATPIGGIPGFTGFGEMFEYNGVIYVTQSGGGNYPNGTYILNFGPPLSLTPAPFWASLYVGVCNKVFTPDYPFAEVNLENGTTNILCPISTSGGGGGFGSSAANLTDDDGVLCDCVSDAGTWVGPPYQTTVCGPENILVPHAGDEILESGDNLVFVLVEGSILPGYPNNILHVFDDPNISFLPGVTQFNEFYRVYAISANAVGNSIDFSDPCRYILGIPFTVRWLSEPSVTFTSIGQNCISSCQTFRASFSGVPPFTLSYQVSTSTGTVGNFTQTFTSANSNFIVCPPAGYSGPLTVTATSISNSVCTCN